MDSKSTQKWVSRAPKRGTCKLCCVRASWSINFFVLVTLVTLSLTAHASEGEAVNDYTGQDMVDWIRAGGGIVSPKQEIRRAVPGDPSSFFGVFATDRIESGEVLLSVPWDLIIKPRNFKRHTDFDCDLVDVLAKEMRLGGESKFAPYVTYLSNQRWGQLPVAWSKEGRDLLLHVAGEDLLALDDMNEKTSWPHQGCSFDGSDDPLVEHAFHLIVQRAEDTLMIPYYCMYNHRNGHWLNTKMVILEGNRVDMLARGRIERGEEIFNSYNRCNPCNLEKADWEPIEGDVCDEGWYAFGTIEMFQNFGFVEAMPRNFFLEPEYDEYGQWIGGPQLCVDETKDGQFDVIWLFDSEDKENIDFLIEQKKRLDATAKEKLDRKAYARVSDHEWHTIWQLHEAISSSFSKVLDLHELEYEASHGKEWEGDAEEEDSEDEEEEDSEDEEEEDSEDEEEGVCKDGDSCNDEF